MSSQIPQAGNGTAGPVIRRTDFDGTESVSSNVLQALDSLPNFDVETSEETLFQYVDPDALDALFRSPGDDDRAEGWVSFPVGDYEVTVTAQGDIVVRARSR